LAHIASFPGVDISTQRRSNPTSSSSDRYVNLMLCEAVPDTCHMRPDDALECTPYLIVVMALDALAIS